MSFSSQPVVIDGKGHLLGRLASIVSKQVSREPLSKIVTGHREDRNKQPGGVIGESVGESRVERNGQAERRDREATEMLAELLEESRAISIVEFAQS